MEINNDGTAKPFDAAHGSAAECLQVPCLMEPRTIRRTRQIDEITEEYERCGYREWCPGGSLLLTKP